jgi:hypothetical protein
MQTTFSGEQAFAFSAVGSMCLVSMINGKMSENEIEEIYIQIHQSDRMSTQTEFSLEALDNLKERLEINYHQTQASLLSDMREIHFEHDQAVEIINMALDVIKSNKEIPAEKIDVLSGLCKVLNIYSDEFNFAT